MSASVFVHFVGPLTVPIDSLHNRVMNWGEQLEVTPERRALGADRNGESVFDLADNEAEQIRRWGRRLMVDGPWPTENPRYEPGSSEAAEAREAARKAAWRIEDSAERAAALRALRREFGVPATSSRTMMEVPADGL